MQVPDRFRASAETGRSLLQLNRYAGCKFQTVFVAGFEDLHHNDVAISHAAIVNDIVLTHQGVPLVSQKVVFFCICRHVILLRFVNLHHNDVAISHAAIVNDIVLTHQGVPLVSQKVVFFCICRHVILLRFVTERFLKLQNSNKNKLHYGYIITHLISNVKSNYDEIFQNHKEAAELDGDFAGKAEKFDFYEKKKTFLLKHAAI